MRRFLRSAVHMASLCQVASAFSLQQTTRGFNTLASTAARHSTPTALNMSPRNRGLERRRETATPEAGGMLLYLKAGPEGTDVGDCPFAHFVRLVMEEKGLEYDLQPAVAATKPNWLIEHYEGKMPALRHRKECYVESEIICEYLDFFFPDPSLKAPKKKGEEAEDAIGDFFPAMARYIKQTGEDSGEREYLEECLSRLETHLAESGSEYLCGTDVSLIDCSLIPKLYHMTVAVEEFKEGKPAIGDYPSLDAYFSRFSERSSYQNTLYPKETVIWGWNNARS